MYGWWCYCNSNRSVFGLVRKSSMLVRFLLPLGQLATQWPSIIHMQKGLHCHPFGHFSSQLSPLFIYNSLFLTTARKEKINHLCRHEITSNLTCVRGHIAHSMQGFLLSAFFKFCYNFEISVLQVCKEDSEWSEEDKNQSIIFSDLCLTNQA